MRSNIHVLHRLQKCSQMRAFGETTWELLLSKLLLVENYTFIVFLHCTLCNHWLRGYPTSSWRLICALLQLTSLFWEKRVWVPDEANVRATIVTAAAVPPSIAMVMWTLRGCFFLLNNEFTTEEVKLRVVTRPFNSHHPSDVLPRSPCMVHAPGLVSLDLQVLFYWTSLFSEIRGFAYKWVLCTPPSPFFVLWPRSTLGVSLSSPIK